MFMQSADINVKSNRLLILAILSVLNCLPVFAISESESAKINTEKTAEPGYGTAFSCYVYQQKFGPNRTFLLLNALTPLSREQKLTSINFESPTQLPQLFTPQISGAFETNNQSSVVKNIRQLTQVLSPPASEKPNQITVVFQRKSDGSIANMHLDKSSGDPEIDKAAMQAILKATPFSNNPNVKGKTADVRFTFDCNFLSKSKTAKDKVTLQTEIKRDTSFNQRQYYAFLRSLEMQVRRAWVPSDQDIERRTVVIFSVGGNGKLSTPQIYTSSGDPRADQAAINAVKHPGIVAVPPIGLGPKVNVQFTFDRNFRLLKER
ncbi:MAG TPA: TonB family protein [Drouetiella sp.]|jgi:TonB family protein